VAIEVGLNHDLAHLQADAAKLLNSAVEHSYVVHLVRDRSDGVQAATQYLTTCPVRSAYACLTAGSRLVKLVGDASPRELV
jgi:hypothetical protein